MKIKCAKCSKWKQPVYHEGVEGVRQCQLGTDPTSTTVADTPDPGGDEESSGVSIAHPSSQGSATWRGMEAGFQAAREERASADWTVPGYTGVQVDLKELEAKVPEGRFAITMADDRLHFFKVDKPDTGRWMGYTFVKEQAGDQEYGVKSPTRRKLILEKIGEDPAEAMLRYGIEIGKCGHCGRTLTNEESREIGIGPICRGKMPRGFFGSRTLDKPKPEPVKDECSPGQQCRGILDQCSKHSMEYQRRYGRAANE